MDDYHRGDDLGVARQADNLRLLGASRTIRVMVPVAVVLAVVGIAGFNLARSETLRVLWLFLAGCSGLIALGSAVGVRHIRNAANALERGRTLELVLDNEHWQGRLAPHARHERAWTIHFAKPIGWTPQAGTLQVQATYLSDITWPVLLRCPQGLLWPGSKPVPLPR